MACQHELFAAKAGTTWVFERRFVCKPLDCLSREIERGCIRAIWVFDLVNTRSSPGRNYAILWPLPAPDTAVANSSMTNVVGSGITSADDVNAAVAE